MPLLFWYFNTIGNLCINDLPKQATTDSRFPNWEIAKMFAVLIWILIIKVGHNFPHVTIAELLWHAQNTRQDLSLFFS